jgi:FTR1 family protein
MISALLVALREGFEAALIVGIVLVYLNKTGRRALAGYVWWGLGAAGACSVVAAILLDRWRISEDGFEGLMMLAAAVLVVTMILWMNRIARSLKKEIEQRVEVYAQRSSRAAGLGIFLFVFSMVLREGAELVLILRAVELSTSGILVWIGTGVGILIAAGVGLFFFQGTLRIPLGRFFKVTSAILIVVAVQLAITGLHELSEAQWIWSSKREMATIGPIVRNEFFFFVIILGVAGFSVIQQWFAARTPVHSADVNPAERRRREWQFRKQRRWSFAAATLCLIVMIMFAAEFVYARSSLASPSAEPLQAQDGKVQLRISTVEDGKLHFYTTDVSGTVLRFIVVKKGEGDYVTALDACQICGWAGYKQDGQNVICRNCGSAIYIPSIGQAGGCNPVAVKSSIQGGTITVDLSALAYSASSVH